MLALAIGSVYDEDRTDSPIWQALPLSATDEEKVLCPHCPAVRRSAEFIAKGDACFGMFARCS
jgi:hypothetical protein